MPKVDLKAIEQTNATGYPAVHAGVVQGRWYRRVAPATGLTDFGVSHVTLKPGAWSSQRHWHEEEDEVVILLAGEAFLVDDSGRTLMRPGDIATFPKGDGNGHCLINESDADCLFVAIGKPSASACRYPDVDMDIPGEGMGFRHKDGRAFEG